MRRVWGRLFRYKIIMLQMPLYLNAKDKISPIIFRDMELRQLEVLVAIADNGSFSGAARALSTVQSNVSAHISRLEKELATILVERSSGLLTQDGQTVVEHARQVFNQIQDIAVAVESSEKDIAGETRLGCIGTTGRWLMPQFLPVLAEKFPNIHCTISEGSTSSLVPRLIDGSLDACIVHLPVEHDNLESISLFAEDLMLLVDNKHEWAALHKITIAELAMKPLLLPPKNTALRRILDRAAGAQRLVFKPQAEIDGVRLLTSLVYEGFGAAIVPATATPNWLSGNFKRIAVPELPRRVVGWVQRTRPLATKATQAVGSVIREVIEKTDDQQPGVHTGKSAFPLKRYS